MRERFSIGFVIIFVVLFAIGVRLVNDSLGVRENILSRFFVSQITPGPNKAHYFLSFSSGTFNLYDTFQVELRIASSEAITSIKAYLDYEPSLIAVTSMQISLNSFSTWWEDTFDNTAGELKFQASTPTPGFIGNNGLIATITFQAMGEGTANLTYDATSLALKFSDTNILNIAGSTIGAYAIVGLSDTDPPVRSNGAPSGTLPVGTTFTSI